MATSILRSFTFRAEKANPALFRALGETTDASKSGRILRFFRRSSGCENGSCARKAPAHSNTKNICAESDFSALRGRPVINRTFASRYNSRIALNNEWILNANVSTLSPSSLMIFLNLFDPLRYFVMKTYAMTHNANIFSRRLNVLTHHFDSPEL